MCVQMARWSRYWVVAALVVAGSRCSAQRGQNDLGHDPVGQPPKQLALPWGTELAPDTRYDVMVECGTVLYCMLALCALLRRSGIFFVGHVRNIGISTRGRCDGIRLFNGLKAAKRRKSVYFVTW